MRGAGPGLFDGILKPVSPWLALQRESFFRVCRTLEARFVANSNPVANAEKLNQPLERFVFLAPCGNRSLRSASRPAESHRERGIRRKTSSETTVDPIGGVTLGLATVFDFLASRRPVPWSPIPSA